MCVIITELLYYDRDWISCVGYYQCIVLINIGRTVTFLNSDYQNVCCQYIYFSEKYVTIVRLTKFKVVAMAYRLRLNVPTSASRNMNHWVRNWENRSMMGIAWRLVNVLKFFIQSFVLWTSFVHSFAKSFVCSFVCSFKFTPSLIHSSKH